MYGQLVLVLDGGLVHYGADRVLLANIFSAMTPAAAITPAIGDSNERAAPDKRGSFFYNAHNAAGRDLFFPLS
jgi:hypothetical protein